MSHTVKKESPVARDRKDRGETIVSDEFDDELTEPVSSADGHRHDRHDGSASIAFARLPRFTVPGDHFDAELTAPVFIESDEDDSVDDDRLDEPVASSEPSPADMPDDDRPLEPGFVLRDRFEIVELVHTGGMSRVYKAVDRRRHPPGSEQSFVAIKMLRPSMLPERDALETLEREAGAAQHLSHPNIVNIFDFDTHDEHFYLVMEWLEGKSVKELLQCTTGHNLAPELAWQIIRDVANALEHAHQNDIVHADINLSNVFVTDTKQIKLLDFGVSRRAGNEKLAADELIWVTHKYASPEVLSGSIPVFADDIFALGCVAYRLLGGRHPFAGLSSLQAEETGLVLHPVSGLTAGQWRILKQSLAFTRADRPSSVSVFLEHEPPWPEDVVQRVRYMPRAAWLVALSFLAVAAITILWSLPKTSPPEEAVAVRQPPVVAAPTVHDASADNASITDASSVSADLDERLRQAAQAMSDGRYLSPAGNNARELYGEVLAIDPDNRVAADGLRMISDVFVQQARSALTAGNPGETTAALAIAAETDPANPAIAKVNDLLAAGVDAQRAPVDQEAVDEGRPIASTALSETAPDPLVEAQDRDATRQLNTAGSEEQQLVEAISRAEDYIAARRLTLPPDDSAYSLVLELREQHGNDKRLLATTSRLGDALLTEAAIAAAARDDAEAARLLGAAESLNADPAEIERISQVLAINAREALAARAAPAPADAREQPSGPTAASTDKAATQAGNLTAASADDERTRLSPAPIAAQDSRAGATETERRRQPPATDAEDGSTAQAAVVAAPAAIPDQRSGSAVAAASRESAPPPMADTREPPTGSATAARGAQAQPRFVSLADMKIEKYVAPVYPRGARRRGLTGNVEMSFSIRADGSTGNIEVLSSQPGDVFVSSATKAVGKWRFEPPGEVVVAQVNIRFEEE